MNKIDDILKKIETELDKEFAESFKEVHDKYEEMLIVKERHLNEVLEYFIKIQEKYIKMLNEAQSKGSAKKIQYLTGLTHGITMIVGLLKTYVKGK